MVYLSEIYLPGQSAEERFLHDIKRTCYNSYYPFQIFPEMGLDQLRFTDVSILYGGNGSGKTTLLNVIADKLRAKRQTAYNRSNFFMDFVERCELEFLNPNIDNCHIITSDDVFDYMLDVRHMNQNIDVKRDEMFEEYMELKHSDFKFRTMDDYETLKKVNLARSKTQSKFIRHELVDNVREFSNGESAFQYFVRKIDESGLFLLDEPENSLSPEKQIELVQFIENSARFYNCQFIIATHSPFVLSMAGATLYDLDSRPAARNKWTQLKNVRAYYDFFKEHEREFE